MTSPDVRVSTAPGSSTSTVSKVPAFRVLPPIPQSAKRSASFAVLAEAITVSVFATKDENRPEKEAALLTYLHPFKPVALLSKALKDFNVN